MTIFDEIDIAIEDMRSLQSTFTRIREANMVEKANVPQTGKEELCRYLFTAEQSIANGIIAAYNVLNLLK